MSTLFIVATPIGNLDDLSPRAIETLRKTDFVLCEDTRVTRHLLEKFEIKTPTMSYHQHSGFFKITEIIDLLKSGKNLALVSDAGTPGISDPGNKLIDEIIKVFGNDFKIEAIPGPNAAITALSISGFPTDEFVFLGFPPHKKGRETFFRELAEEKRTAVFYESMHRILKCLDQIEKNMPERKIIVCRELTKMFETTYRGTASEVQLKLKNDKIKGEFVVVIRNK
jgi:16S rRNA (cytidine1402-2'-O)-methyltransferase